MRGQAFFPINIFTSKVIVVFVVYTKPIHLSDVVSDYILYFFLYFVKCILSGYREFLVNILLLLMFPYIWYVENG